MFVGERQVARALGRLLARFPDAIRQAELPLTACAQPLLIREGCGPFFCAVLAFDEFLFEYHLIFRKRFGRKEGLAEIQVAGRPALFLTKISDIG